MKEPKYYICEFCQNEYTPNRRKIQKYCSDTCRSKACYHRKKNNEQSKPQTNFPQKVSYELDNSKKQVKTKVEQVSSAGVGNAMAGSLLADGVKSLFTNEKNKPATKGDLKELAIILKGRYHLILNADPIEDGRRAYFDMETKNVVYLFPYQINL